jgi:hypothetical protein
MKKLLTLLFISFIAFNTYAANISLYDSEGNYFWGRLNSGNISLYDSDGNYYWGQVN